MITIALWPAIITIAVVIVANILWDLFVLWGRDREEMRGRDKIREMIGNRQELKDRFVHLWVVGHSTKRIKEMLQSTDRSEG